MGDSEGTLRVGRTNTRAIVELASASSSAYSSSQITGVLAGVIVSVVNVGSSRRGQAFGFAIRTIDEALLSWPLSWLVDGTRFAASGETLICGDILVWETGFSAA